MKLVICQFGRQTYTTTIFHFFQSFTSINTFSSHPFITYSSTINLFAFNTIQFTLYFSPTLLHLAYTISFCILISCSIYTLSIHKTNITKPYFTLFSFLLKGSIEMARMNYELGSPELELKLHLSPPRDHRQVSAHRSISPQGSCASQEASSNDSGHGSVQIGSMMLVGCPRCLMYVMLKDEDPKCPKCKSTVLLDFLHDDKSSLKSKIA